MLKVNANFSERLKKSLNGIEVECAKSQDNIHYRLSVKTYKEIVIDFVVEDDGDIHFNTYHAGNKDSSFYIKRDDSILPIYLIETECYGCFIGNYIREQLTDIEDVEAVVKFFCEFIGVEYVKANHLEVEELHKEQFDREIAEVGQDYVYALFARNIYSLGYLKDNYVYTQIKQNKFVRVNLGENVLGLISLVLLNEKDFRKQKIIIAEIIDATLYGIG